MYSVIMMEVVGIIFIYSNVNGKYYEGLIVGISYWRLDFINWSIGDNLFLWII